MRYLKRQKCRKTLTKRILNITNVLASVGLLAVLATGLKAQSPQEKQTNTPRSLTEAAKSANTPQAMRRENAPPGIRSEAPATETQGGLTFFNNQAEFEAFIAGQGKVLKGVEDYEECILDPNQVDGFDDPLEFGVPNSPDGFPFPNGMTGLSNLIVQSNTLGNDPVDESPAGLDGLAAASVDFLGVTSDVVLSNTFANGLDLIFLEEKTAVGFSIVDALGPQTGVTVRVYSPSNQLLGTIVSPAEVTGANFLGMWATLEPIGRINLFSGGAEGGDRIQAWAAGSGCGDPESGSCFENNGTPFCNDVECCELVCAVDPFCCETSWDDICVNEAQELCAGCGDADAGSCFEGNGTPGCDNAVCCAFVCNGDPFCCEEFWDSICAGEAQDFCASCGGEVSGSCFVVNGTAACNDIECCELVCAADPFCCETTWDALCVDGAQDLCAGCGDAGAGSCFEDNGTPGCDNAQCCAVVCDEDPFCCEVSWDSLCASAALELCVTPPENDLCINAIPLKIPDFAVGFTNDATIDDSFPFCVTSITAPGIWYSVIGTGNTITATTCSEFTEYDTKISVYCNSCDDPICVTGNDDNCADFQFRSTVEWCSQAGAEYLILVHGFAGETGGFDLSVFDDGVVCMGPANCLLCIWDLDGSGSVGTSDLLALFAQWGTGGPADFDGSGAVGTADLLILFAHWGPCE